MEITFFITNTEVINLYETFQDGSTKRLNMTKSIQNLRIAVLVKSKEGRVPTPKLCFIPD
jgi:hypothetical protein